MELLDYKSGLQTARRELNECRQQLTNSNELSRELTDRVAELTQTREEQGEQLKQLNSDLFRVKDELQGCAWHLFVWVSKFNISIVNITSNLA